MLHPAPLGSSLTAAKTIRTAGLIALANNRDPEQHAQILAQEAAHWLKKSVSRSTQQNIEAYQADQTPYVLIKGLVSSSNLVKTPTNDRAPTDGSWHPHAAALLGLLKLGGLQAASLYDEMGGRLYHMVMPSRNSALSQHRSTKPLNLHTEVVNGQFGSGQGLLSPKGFALLCLRNPAKVPTTLLPIKEVLMQLSTKTIQQLMLPQFSVKSQSSLDKEILVTDQQVLERSSAQNLSMRMSYSKLVPQTSQAELALTSLKQIIDKTPTIDLALEPGDALLIHNRICLHGRKELNSTARFDGNDRWLIRLYGFDPEQLKNAQFHPQDSHALLV